MLSLKYYEVQSHLTTTNLFTGFGMVVMNDRKFQSLKKSEQDAILQAGKEAGEYSWGLTAQCDKDGIARSKKQGLNVIELTAEQRAPFFQIARSVWPEFEKRVGGKELIDRLVNASK